MDTVIEKKYPPEWVEERITLAGGLNIYGKPNFRVIWGGNRRHLVGGMFKKPVVVKDDTIIGKEVTIITEVAEMRDLLKYHPFRWHLERWRGPEFYGSREDWYLNTWDEASQLHTMGDYPSEGDYEHVFFLAQCPHMMPLDTEWCMLCKASMGEYIPLEENVHILERQIKAHILSDDTDKEEERKSLFLRENEKRQVRRKQIEERIRNAMRPKLVMNPSTLMDGLGRCNVPEAKMSVGVDREDVELGISQITKEN